MNTKTKQRILVSFLSVAAMLVLLAAGTVKENKYNPTLGDGNSVIEPVHTETIDEDRENYTFKGLDLNETNNTFLFYTNHLEVFVYADDVLVYSLESDESAFGRTPGAMWNIMSLPVDTETIRVETVQAYPSLAQQDIKFELGNAITMQRDVVVNSIFDVCVCLCILIIGVALFAYWVMVFRKTNEQKELLYLGVFAWIFGIWAFL